MKIVFLDFDGVLNSKAYEDSLPQDQRQHPLGIDPLAVARLNVLCARSGAVVIVTSMWRLKRTVHGLRAILTDAGFTGTVLGKTSGVCQQSQNKRLTRGEEIQAWLDCAPLYGIDVESFVIIDDNDDMGHLSNELVRTTFASGLQDEHVNAALWLLERRADRIVFATTDDIARYNV